MFTLMAFSSKDIERAVNGKSFCYALFPTVFGELHQSIETLNVICISPLTALMVKQRTKFTTHRIATGES